MANSDAASQYGNCQGGNVDGDFHLVTTTFDGANANLYVDGVKVAGPCSFPNFIGLRYSAARIGAYNNFPLQPYDSLSGFWYGKISDVRIYNRVLTVAEMQAILAAHKSDN